MKNHKFSIIVASKNSYPYIIGTIESLKNQKYKNFEVIVIDCLSKDKTLRYLKEQEKFLDIKIFSEIDNGISDGYNKGFSKIKGDIISLLSTDERYYEDTLLKVNKWFLENPHQAMIAGSVDFINKQDAFLYNNKNKDINFYNHITARNVPTFASAFFNKNILREDLYFDVTQKTVPDYEFWARVFLKYEENKFLWLDDPIVKAIDDDVSMSRNFKYFDQMTSDKIEYFNNFYKKNKYDPAIRKIDPDTCRAEIYMWAAESLKSIKAEKKIIYKFLQMSNKYQLKNKRLIEFIKINQNYYFKNDNLLQLYTPTKYKVVKKLNYSCKKILGNDRNPWGYKEKIMIKDKIFFKFNLNKFFQFLNISKNFYSIKVTVEIVSGSIGISQLYKDMIINEDVYTHKGNMILSEIIFPIKKLSSIEIPIMIRNAGDFNSNYKIKDIELIFGS